MEGDLRHFIREVSQDVDGDEIAVICIGGQGPTAVMVDAAGHSLCSAILWMDTRTTAEQETLSEQFGTPVSPYSYLPKAM